jgi:S-adenosylmethionine:tRNA ribosyltransferase-isomerase
VLNDTKVIPARLFGNRATGGRVELFILEKTAQVCEALVRPSGRIKSGERIVIESGDVVEILDRGPVGRFVRFERSPGDVMCNAGHVPLPPYIERPDERSDISDYQTVYGTKEGATASPTAGLHFTHDLIEGIRGKGVRIAHVTLHTSYGTFAPVKSADVELHRMHEERFEMQDDTAKIVLETRSNGRKVFAVGTTSVRVLEHCAQESRRSGAALAGRSGRTGLYIYPGHDFRVVDRLITNFHLPKSTLLLLVSAFAGKDFILEAYRRAVENRYRFFSYGDAMLIL